MSGLKNRLWKILQPRGSGHGPWSDDGASVDPEPFSGWTRSGIFFGHDGSFWLYAKMPSDVRVDFAKSTEEALESQEFFVGITRDLGKLLNSYEDSTRNAVTRQFHIVMTVDQKVGIDPHPNSSAKKAEYIESIISDATRPHWTSYIGVKLMPGSMMYDQFTFRDKMMRYIDLMANASSVDTTQYAKDMEDVRRIFSKHGCANLDFQENKEDLGRLIGWYGDKYETYGLQRRARDIAFLDHSHGLSVTIPKWDETEVAFFSLTPNKELDHIDPLHSEKMAWGAPLLSANNNVVCVSIRGDIVAGKVADNLMDQHQTRRRSGTGEGHLIAAARESVEEQVLPMLDNTDIVVGVSIPQEERHEPPIINAMSEYGIEASNIQGRQTVSLLSTLPTYPLRISPHRRSLMSSRSPLTNVMLPPMLAFSGLFKASKPCTNDGLYMGLALADKNLSVVYTDWGVAKKYGTVPGFGVFGSPGSGKTQFLNQVVIQAVADRRRAAFINPKSVGTLEPVFEHVGGVTIRFSPRFLRDRPGIMDPLLYISDRSKAAKAINMVLVSTMKMEDGTREGTHRANELMANITQRTRDLNNKSAYDVIYGNGSTTDPLPMRDVVEFVTNRVESTELWKAIFGRPAESAQVMKSKIQNAPAFLFEWSDGLKLPDESSKGSYSSADYDAINSLILIFSYCAALMRDTGGVIIADEAHNFMASREAADIFSVTMREGRQADIDFILASQKITDWGTSGKRDTDLLDFFSRFLFLNIEDNSEENEELNAFFGITGLPRTVDNSRFITRASRRHRKHYPVGYFIDRASGWEGGITNVYPQWTLKVGGTDAENESLRKAEEDARRAMQSGSLEAGMVNLLTENEPEDADAEESDQL